MLLLNWYAQRLSLEFQAIARLNVEMRVSSSQDMNLVPSRVMIVSSLDKRQSQRFRVKEFGTRLYEGDEKHMSIQNLMNQGRDSARSLPLLLPITVSRD